jgi:uncharacterized protein (TIGR00251 family)
MRQLPGYVVASKDGSLLDVFVQPRAAKDGLVGLHGDALKIKVKAPPEDGKANRAACELVAGLVGVPARDVEVASGAGSRHKRIAIGAAPETVVKAVERVLSSRAPKGGSTGGP